MISDYSKLDLAFVLDTTGSMGTYIQHAKQNINKIADEIRRSEKCDLRVGLVNYRDHPPQERTYVTQVNQLTDKITDAREFVMMTEASGGGDFPEAICCGLGDCLNKLKWRADSVKVVILIADAPPHGLGLAGDGFPKGCPQKKDPIEIAHRMAQNGITLYTAGCEPSLTNYRTFFVALSLITGGQYVPLDSSDRLTEVIVGGAREDISMEKLMAKVNNEYMKEVAEKGGRVNEEELTKRIHQVLNSSSEAKINAIKDFKAIKITDEIKELGKQSTLAEFVGYAKKNKISLDMPHSCPLESKRKRKKDDEYKPELSEDEETEYKPRLRSCKKTAVEAKGAGAARGRAAKSKTTTVEVKEEKPKEKLESSAAKEDESINEDQARRLAKKVLARNK